MYFIVCGVSNTFRAYVSVERPIRHDHIFGVSMLPRRQHFIQSSEKIVYSTCGITCIGQLKGNSYFCWHCFWAILILYSLPGLWSSSIVPSLLSRTSRLWRMVTKVCPWALLPTCLWNSKAIEEMIKGHEFCQVLVLFFFNEKVYVFFGFLFVCSFGWQKYINRSLLKVEMYINDFYFQLSFLTIVFSIPVYSFDPETKFVENLDSSVF